MDHDYTIKRGSGRVASYQQKRDARVMLKLERSLLDALKAEAAKRGISVSYILREGAMRWLASVQDASDVFHYGSKTKG